MRCGCNNRFHSRAVVVVVGGADGCVSLLLLRHVNSGYGMIALEKSFVSIVVDDNENNNEAESP
jgi:hypothetical protein